MAPPKKSKPAEESECEFSDIDGSNLDSGDEVEIEDNTLNWVCPTVGPHAKRNEFEAVSGRLCTKL